jgi:lipid-binding SYLF domain-containing protein
MKHRVKSSALSAALIMAAVTNLLLPSASFAASASEIRRESRQALITLYKTTPGAEALAEKALGILVFPKVIKGGLIIGAQYGDGALREDGKTVAYYRSISGSIGLQAGAEAFGYVLLFMDEASLRYLKKSNGWKLGTGPTLVVLDKGFGKNLSTTTVRKGVYAFIFDQRGLMGGIGIQGSKISKIVPQR